MLVFFSLLTSLFVTLHDDVWLILFPGCPTKTIYLFIPLNAERTLRLTGLCLKLNPANYTIWHFRRQCLDTIMANSSTEEDATALLVQKDLAFAATLGGANPKNYQIWYHRRALLESAGTKLSDEVIAQELAYVAKVLNEDSKNYHAWSHRQWMVRTVDKEELWEKELEFGRYYGNYCY